MKYILLLGLLVSVTSVANTDATTEEERRYLIKIAQDLAHLDELAAKAQNKADPQARINFDYMALRNDLQEMKRALESHITKPSRSPRNIKSLELASKN